MIKRMLVVEDEPDIAWMFRVLFEPSFAVTIATGLAAAREALADPQTYPDVVLLDLGLPDGDGLDLCQEIKAADRALPILIVSANRDARRKAWECGADGFLAKPVELDDVETAVGRLLAA